MEKKISKTFQQAADELSETITEYFAKFTTEDAEKMTQVEAGEITERQYKRWRLEEMQKGQRFKKLRDKLAERVTKANEIALAYINGTLPEIYALNWNYTAFTVEKLYGDYGFTLFDESTVKRLITEEPDLLPGYPKPLEVDRPLDLAWNRRQVTSTITSSILQGKSIPEISADLQKRIETMDSSSATRAARTAITNAENAGRQDTYQKAAEMGIPVRKRWIASKDSDTRKSHQKLDGQTVDWDKPFTSILGSKMMHPGDRSGKPADLWNCRCSMRTVEKPGIEAEPRKMRVKDANGRYMLVNEMTYEEWEKWKLSSMTTQTK